MLGVSDAGVHGPAMADDPRRHAPATLRNRDPLLEVLALLLPDTGTVLEVASGSGEHAAYFAPRLATITWQPSDPSPEARASIAAHAAAARSANLRAPLDLDVAASRWPVDAADAVVAINLLHVSPWQASEGLFAGSARLLAPGAPLIVYGPFRQREAPFAPSNAAFDADLRARDPAWGVRDLDAVEAAARAAGMFLDTVIGMPANNLSLVFRRG